MAGWGDILSGIGSVFKDDDGSINWSNVASIGGGIASALDDSSADKVGYTGGIPAYTATRQAVPGAIDPNRRPGSGGRRYLTDVQYDKSGLLPGYPTPEQLAAANSQSGANTQAFTDFLNSLRNQGQPSPASPAGTPKAPNATLKPSTPTAGLPSINPTPPPSQQSAPPPPPQEETGTPYSPQNPATWTPEELQYSQQYKTPDSPANNVQDVQNYAQQAQQSNYDPNDTRKYDDGEVITLFNMVAEMGLSPAQAASMLGVSEADVVARLRHDLPHQSYSYLKSNGYAKGGIASVPRYLKGKTDGMADEVPAAINGNEPAALSDGEFVIPADAVAALGNGNSDAGAQVLYDMMDRVRQSAHGSKKQMNRIKPQELLPV